jgi:preprotein translocase subunit SecA
MRELERRVLLTVLDRKWREHLYEMDYLREGIGLRAMAQRDPLVEYQREGGDMFKVMMDAFMEEVVGFVFHLEVEVTPSAQVGVVTGDDGQAVQIGSGSGASRNGKQPKHLVESGPDPDGPGVAVHVLDEEDEIEVGAEPSDDELAALDETAARPEVKAKGLAAKRNRPLSYSAPAEDGSVKTVGSAAATADEYAGTGRNAPCPCGSGKKYKMCHGRSGA